MNGTNFTAGQASGFLPIRACFSSSKVNEFRFGYNSLFNNISQELANVENVNEKLNTPIKVTDPNSWGIPDITLGSSLSSFGNGRQRPVHDRQQGTFRWSTTSPGSGASTRSGSAGSGATTMFLQIGNEFARGRFTTDGQFTGNPARNLAGGYHGADFLMGAFSRIEAAVALARSDFRNNEVGLYIDDTYKVTPRLTINVGLRWEVAPAAARQVRAPAEFPTESSRCLRSRMIPTRICIRSLCAPETAISTTVWRSASPARSNSRATDAWETG